MTGKKNKNMFFVIAQKQKKMFSVSLVKRLEILLKRM